MNVREAAFHSLIAVCKDGAYSNIVVSKIIQKEKFTDRDRRFYTELVYGTLRSLNYVDYIIGILSSRKKTPLIRYAWPYYGWGFINCFLWIKYLRRQLVMKP